MLRGMKLSLEGHIISWTVCFSHFGGIGGRLNYLNKAFH